VLAIPIPIPVPSLGLSLSLSLSPGLSPGLSPSLTPNPKVRLLLRNGAWPNPGAADNPNPKWTPLHWAAQSGSADAAAALLEHGADPTLKNNYKRIGITQEYDNAMDVAKLWGAEAVVEVLQPAMPVKPVRTPTKAVEEPAAPQPMMEPVLVGPTLFGSSSRNNSFSMFKEDPAPASSADSAPVELRNSDSEVYQPILGSSPPGKSSSFLFGPDKK